jgi:hypothetical protein
MQDPEALAVKYFFCNAASALLHCTQSGCQDRRRQLERQAGWPLLRHDDETFGSWNLDDAETVRRRMQECCRGGDVMVELQAFRQGQR